MFSYHDIKEFYNDIKNDKVMIWIFRGIFAIILIALFASAIFSYNDRANNKPVNFLWGLYKRDRTDTFYITKRDTVFLNNQIVPNEREGKTNQKKIANGTSSTFVFKRKVEGQAQQFGDNNIQNNQFGLKPRTETKSIINEVTKQVQDKNTPISVYQRSRDVESVDYATKVVLALKGKGFNNAFVNGIIDDRIIGGDLNQAAKHHATIRYFFEGSQFNIVIPSNQ